MLQEKIVTNKACIMPKYLLFLVMLILCEVAFGQHAFKRNDLYFELFGNGIYASVNYEKQLTSKPGFGLRAGIGYFSGDEKLRVSVPIGVHYLFKLRNEKSFLDAGVGGTWSGAAGLKHDELSGVRDYSEHIVSLVPGIGYRRHTKGNVMWRTNFMMIINKYIVVPYLGLSLGKRF
jgi:hypothetical protein